MGEITSLVFTRSQNGPTEHWVITVAADILHEEHLTSITPPRHAYSQLIRLNPGQTPQQWQAQREQELRAVGWRGPTTYDGIWPPGEAARPSVPAGPAPPMPGQARAVGPEGNGSRPRAAGRPREKVEG
ncbi:hypothetical protein GCM10010149_59190 [Nonomuraea roseoviolacea subsp. roseoviolacea]|uniref:hypothetical protein n=1 Tax=Nonomuraea roseoviolacea TaxID=103837 RepID=UPI0031D698DF